ncbi:hypothetical protein PBY51_012250 [Eleginops maclovinus]|uniref:RIB43A-like with coiled-coils protein 2 n=1 Tax=Eleginops maclovinus TaxID=56733 RepID=A0AAN8AUL3_ELEMC|nr:hypothetical protein PBY51_012250 [Eleginops maclovinus]
MFNFDLASDRLANTSLQRRRNDETERRERIFNDKVRMFGVDKEALNSQMKEKEKQEEAAKVEQNARDAEMLHNNKVACLLHSREVKEKRAVAKTIVDYRLQYQQPLCQRDYDLSAPDRCGNTDPGDALMMLPGLLGEDPDSESRRQRQREQLREWLLQQQGERAAERQRRKMEEHRCEQSRAYMDKKALQLQGIEMQRRKAETVATKEYNLAKRRCSRCQDEQPARAAGRCCTPAPPSAWSLPSSDRKAPLENLQQIIQFQKYQIEEKKRVELEKKRDEEQRDRRGSRQDWTSSVDNAWDSANVMLAQTHKQQEPDIERGSIDDSFFSKFNTCSR